MKTFRVYGNIRVEIEIIVTANSIQEAKAKAKKYGSESWYCDIDEQIHVPVTVYAEESWTD